MLADLKSRLARMRIWTDAVMLIVATVIALGVNSGLGLFMGQAGGLYLELIKGLIALAIGCVVYLIGRWCFDIIASLEQDARRGLVLANIIGVVIIVNVSTYIFVVKLGQEAFTAAYVEDHLEKAARDKDAVVAAINRFVSRASDGDRCQTTVNTMTESERKGGFSGFSAESGPLLNYFTAQSQQCAAMAETFRNAGKTLPGLTAKLDASMAAQHAAAIASDKPLDERVLALRKASETFRNSVLEGLSSLPITAVRNFGAAFQGPQAEPALSKKEVVAKGQSGGLEEARKVQAQIGKQFVDSTEEFTEILATPPAVFKLPSPAELPFLYPMKALPIVGIALALDLSIFWFCFVVGRVSDAIREEERKSGPDAFSEVARLLEAVRRLEASMEQRYTALGPHPFPAAAELRASKANGAASRKTRVEEGPL